MAETQDPFQRRHKPALQALALGMMMLVPIALYVAARDGRETATLVLLLIQGVAMLIAAWVG